MDKFDYTKSEEIDYQLRLGNLGEELILSTNDDFEGLLVITMVGEDNNVQETFITGVLEAELMRKFLDIYIELNKKS